jgi:hypothetical protein
MKAKQALAVKNNVAWCEIMSRLHGCESRVENNLWGLNKKAPIYYPDVITLSNEVLTNELLNFIGDTQVEYIKDSYASLQLEEFEVLFEANWIYHELDGKLSSASVSYRKIHSKEELLSWNIASGLEGILLPNILSHPDVSIYANEGEVVTDGFIVNCSGETIGVSNVFSTEDNSDFIWTDIIAVINKNHNGKHIVGYESDEPFVAAVEAGWQSTGNLKVWRLKSESGKN